MDTAISTAFWAFLGMLKTSISCLRLAIRAVKIRPEGRLWGIEQQG